MPSKRNLSKRNLRRTPRELPPSNTHSLPERCRQNIINSNLPHPNMAARSSPSLERHHLPFHPHPLHPLHLARRHQLLPLQIRISALKKISSLPTLAISQRKILSLNLMLSLTDSPANPNLRSPAQVPTIMVSISERATVTPSKY